MNIRYSLIAACCSTALLAGCGGGGNNNRDRGDDGRDQTNQPPQLSGLTDVSVSANETSAPVAFTVSDDGGADAVVLSASADDTGLLPEDAITFDGSGTNRTLTLTPADGSVGRTNVTVTATDEGGLETSVSFQVEVATQMVSFSGFFREAFAEPANGQPRDLNSRTFEDDGSEGDFDDLIGNP